MRKKMVLKKGLCLMFSIALATSMLSGCADSNNNTNKTAQVSDDDEMDRGVGTEDKRPLERYLKGLLKTKGIDDKQKLLVDNGTGVELDTNSTTKSEGNEFVLIRREKESATSGSEDIFTAEGNLNGLFPGAIVHADSKLVDGRPNIIAGGGELGRKPVKVSVDINGNTLGSATVKNPDQHNVTAAMNKMVEEWQKTGKTAAANLSSRSAMVYDEKQLETELGIKGAADKYGVNIKANVEGKKKEMLVVFNQIYFTARVDPVTASSLFVDTVTPDDLADNGIDESNPAVAQVTSISFGRQIVVKLSTSEMSAEVEAAWNANVCSNEIKNDNKYKQVMNNTTFSVYAYGGTTGTAGQLLTNSSDLAKVNEIIASDVNFTKDSAAKAVSYSTNFIDDGSQARISKTTEYIKTSVEKRGEIEVKTDKANAYMTKSHKFYARPITGVDENGKYTLGNWEQIWSTGNGDITKKISGKYAEFGFSFDIRGGTDWPYSDQFWKVENGPAEKIFLEWGGTSLNAWIKISVNGNQIFKDSDCSSHREHKFN